MIQNGAVYMNDRLSVRYNILLLWPVLATRMRVFWKICKNWLAGLFPLILQYSTSYLREVICQLPKRSHRYIDSGACLYRVVRVVKTVVT